MQTLRFARNPFNASYDVVCPWPDKPESLSLACVARLEFDAKGQDVLIDTLGMPKWRERPVSVTLYGAGRNQKVMEALIAQEKVTSVTFGGFQSDIAALWANHHALIMPSRYEGLPLSQVEAMLCGRPCIVTDVPGNAELIEDGVTGFVAIAPKPAALDLALERAWERRGELQAMGQVARSRARTLIPENPATAWADKLLQIVKSSSD